MNEVIARALGDHDRPEKLTLEPWLYRLALQAMNEMTERLEELGSSVHLEDSQPAAKRRSLRRSPRCNSISRTKAGRERVRFLIAGCRLRNRQPIRTKWSPWCRPRSRGATRTDREAFLLYGIEGFSLGEIAAITGRHPEAVRESVQRARDCVRSAPSIANEFPHELLVKTRT